jgi:hypothetical protein
MLEDAECFCKSLPMQKTARKMPPKLSHQWIDLVDLAMHRAIVRKIRREPTLFNRAGRTLTRWEKVKRACPPPLREWKQILQNNDRNTVLRMLTRLGDEETRLRSTSPFCGILTQREVEAVWARYD